MNKQDAANRKHVLFINADREYREGKAQNFLRPEDIAKIVHVYRERKRRRRLRPPGAGWTRSKARTTTATSAATWTTPHRRSRTMCAPTCTVACLWLRSTRCRHFW